MPATDLPEYHPFRSAEARDRYLSYYDEQGSSWPIASENRLVRTEYGETFMRISGPPDAPPLVLLPGGRAPSLCWTSMIGALSEQYRTYALDAIYDVGRSVNSKPILKPSDVTSWLDGVFDALSLTEGVNLMGLSLGGWAAAEYALLNPQRLSKVVWMAPAGVTAPISGGFIRRSIMCIVPSQVTFGAFMRWIMPTAAASEGPARELFDDAVDDIVVSARSYKMRPFPGGPRALSDEELAAIKVPVLYVVGDRERACADPKAAVARVNKVAPRIETALIPDVGHDLIFLEPESISQRVLAFLRQDDGAEYAHTAEEAVV